MANIFSPKGAGIFQQRSTADLFQARNSGKSDDVSERLIATLKKAGANNIEALQEKRAENKETQAQLDALKRQSDPAEVRKARAREKIDQIKMQLEALRMLANVDPEAAARQAARLSRELAAAVREYASAGGDAGALSGTNGPSAPADAAADGNAESSGSDASSPATSVANAAPAGSSAGDGDAGTQNPSQAERTVGAEDTVTDTSQFGGDERSDKGNATGEPEDTHPDRARADAFQNLYAERQQRSSEGQGEREFADDIKKLKRQLESLIERGVDETDNDSEARELNKGLRALKDVDDALIAMSSPISASLGVINIIA